MDLQLSGKRALVTGSSSGIGEAIAKLLAAEGARVIVQGRREAEVDRVRREIEQAGGGAHGAVGDVSLAAEAAAVAETALTALGGIDILVNNAGAAPLGGWFDASPELWRDLYEQNVGSVVRMVQHLVPGMRERGWGRVINLGSIVADSPRGPNPHYSATKAAKRQPDGQPGQGAGRHRHHGQFGQPRPDPHTRDRALDAGLGQAA